MTATLEIPDPLYQQVAAESARRGADVTTITVRLYSQWLEKAAAEAGQANPPATTAPPTDRLAALKAWVRSATESMRQSPPGPSAREMLLEDRRNRTP